MSVIVTKTLLKVVISILGDDASAKWIEGNNFLNLTEDEQVELVARLTKGGSMNEPESAVEEKDAQLDVFAYASSNKQKVNEESEDVDEFDTSSYDDIEALLDELYIDPNGYVKKVETTTTTTKTLIFKPKNFKPTPKTKGEFFLQRKIFGKRGKR